MLPHFCQSANGLPGLPGSRIMTAMPPDRRKLIQMGVVLLVLLALVTVWLILTPPGGWNKLDAVAYSVCHRIPSHSFSVNGQPLPLCARCSGMYLGAFLSLVVLLPGRKTGFPTRPILAVLAALLLAVALDGVNSYLTLLPNEWNLYEPLNWLRMATGSGLGIGIGAVLSAAFAQVIWQDPDPRPALDGKRLLILVSGMVLLNLAILSDIPLFLYPLAILSVTGVVLALSLIYTALWVMLLKRDNTFPTWRSLWLNWVIGLDTAFAQILAFDLLRFALTGTWTGFFS